MLETLPEVAARYTQYRQVVYEATAKEFSAHGITLRSITTADAHTADRWSDAELSPERIPVWSWRTLYNNYNSTQGIKRFDVAVYSGSTLCALCYGLPSKKKLILKLHVLQRMPSPNPIEGKTLDIILVAANLYARLLGAFEVWICDPMNEQLVKVYKGRGFKETRIPATGKVSHLSKEISK